tara:strand:+ start:333 stop:1607 length:1275 start_codon:yes stop_codon:yes gene_type:complete
MEEEIEDNDGFEEVKIYTADDSRKYASAWIKFVGTNDGEETTYGRFSRRWYNRSEGNNINPNMFRSSHEPTIAATNKWLEEKCGLNRKGIRNFSYTIYIGKDDPLMLLFNKIGTRYHLMGEMQSKETILTAISRVLFRSSFNIYDKNELYSAMLHHLRLPENVSYALENRAPFHWYKKGKKVDVRFNVQMISDDECAMEISDGIWCPISVKNLNTYMNFYWKNQERGSWKYLSPKKLWIKLLKKEPTENQLNLMINFLEQNRTDEIVEDRASTLLTELSEQYPNRIKVLWYESGESNSLRAKALFVRGKIADWVLTDNQYKTEIQAVSTFVFVKEESNTGKYKLQDGYLSGPICIDNMSRNSSVGDQFAARALALLNDYLTVTRVNTVSRYLDKHEIGQEYHRIDMENFGDEDVEQIVSSKSRL